jgi:citrate lyase subunit beta / citryl-CoA lyase
MVPGLQARSDSASEPPFVAVFNRTAALKAVDKSDRKQVMRIIRSLLFAPANRHELLRKFPGYPADAFAIDLEDGTPENDKAAARDQLPAIVAYLEEQRLKATVFVRTNGPRSHHIQADLAAAQKASADGIIVPKLETIEDLKAIDISMPVIGIIETVRGVANVETLTAQKPQHLHALAFGAEDFITDMGGRRTNDGLEVLYARSRVVLAARLGGLQALDQVFTGIRNDEAFRRDAEFGRQLGYDGKMCITPRQVELANDVFFPTLEEVDRSRRLIEAYEAAQSSGRGVIEFEGSMIDEPLLKRARAILQLAGERDA